MNVQTHNTCIHTCYKFEPATTKTLAHCITAKSANSVQTNINKLPCNADNNYNNYYMEVWSLKLSWDISFPKSDSDIMLFLHIGYTSKLDKSLSTDSPFVSVNTCNYAMMLTPVMMLIHWCHSTNNKGNIMLHASKSDKHLFTHNLFFPIIVGSYTVMPMLVIIILH